MTERYRLAPVRDARDREVRVKRGHLAAAVTDARASEAQVGAAAARVEAATIALAAARSSSVPGSSALALARAELFIVRRRRDLALARETHARAVASHAGQLASVDAARTRLAGARADREVIERHFTRWREERAKLADRRAD